MKEQSTQPTYFALALASFLLAIVLLFNMLSPMAVPVTKEQFDQIREADLIEYLIVQPRGFTWQLTRAVRVQGPNGETVTKRIELAEPDPTVAEDWRQKGGAVRQEQDTSWWGGMVFIALLLGVGGMAHLVPNTARSQRGEGGRAAACATWKPRSNKAKLPKPNSGSRPSGSGPSCEDIWRVLFAFSTKVSLVK